MQVILIDPAEPGGIGSELRRHAFRHLTLEEIQPFQNPGAGEVGIDLVLEDDGGEREAEHGSGAHFLHSGESLQTGGEREGHLVFHFLRAAAHPVGIDQHLVFRQIRDGVHRREVNGADAKRD